MERKLAAILAADVVGYARLMEHDEAGTLEALRRHRERVIEPKAAQYHGRIVKLMGDGLLMEFASVVEAVTFAVDVQVASRLQELEMPDRPRLVFRMGINLGDVILEDRDIYGDGVNVAARLEALATPGGICLSRAARDQVQDKLDLDFEDLGDIEVKNITRPVRVFSVAIDDKAEALATPVVAAVGKPHRRLKLGLAVGFALAMSIAVALVWWRPDSTPLDVASLDHMAFPLPDRPSIAVLPFDDYSGGGSQEHIADGVTEAIISTLARIPDLFVIARNSSFTYKGEAVKVQQVAEELGVRYVLEGSVQHANHKLRITVQLIDALTGHHLWSETYDRNDKDLFDIQDEIALKTAVALQVKLTTGEEARVLSRTTENLRAWILYQQALSNFFKFTAESSRNARALAEKALLEDPNFADAMIIVGFTHLVDARSSYSASSKASLEAAIAFADRAQALAPDAPNLYNLLQSIYRYQGRFEEAVAAGEKAIELSPNSAISLLATAMTTNLAGQFGRSVELAEKAIRQNPHSRSTGYIWLGRSLWFNGEYERAIAAAKEGLDRAESSAVAVVHLLNLALAYLETGDVEKAKQAAAEALEKEPATSISWFKSGYDYKESSDWARFASGLRAAGVPE